MKSANVRLFWACCDPCDVLQMRLESDRRKDRTMKRSRFSEEQIIAVPREQEAGFSTADVCRKHRISSATFYAWKAKFGGMDVSEAKRLKALEDENAKLKRLLAPYAFAGKPLSGKGRYARQCRVEGSSHKKILTPPPSGKLSLISPRLRDERAAGVSGHSGGPQDGSLPIATADDAALRERLRQLAAEQRRFGYRRLMCFCAMKGTR